MAAISEFPVHNDTAYVTLTFVDNGKDVITETLSSKNLTAASDIGYIQQATFNRITNGIGTFSVSIADPSWFKTENTILKYKGICKLEYGYLEGKLKSPTLQARIFNYALDYDMGRVIVKAKGMLTGYSLATDKGWVIDQKSKNIKQLFEEIVTKSGLIKGKIEPIDESKSVDFTDLLTSNSGPIRIGNSQGETPVQVITQKLIKHAISAKSGKGGYVFTVSYRDAFGNKSDIPCIHFCTPEYYETQDTATPMNPNRNLIRNIYTLFDTTPDPRVKEYIPSWNATIVDIMAGAGVTNTAFNAITGETQTTTVDPKQDPKKDSPTDKTVTAASAQEPGAGAAAATAVAQAYALMCPITAELVLRGDPTLDMLDPITVKVRIPPMAGNTHSGKLHKMSGAYLALQIVDTIDNGMFTTKVKLVISPRIARLSQGTDLLTELRRDLPG
jgi:hypothetical protein